MIKADFSNYVLHFTKNGDFLGDHNVNNEIKTMTAYQRVINILKEGRIIASKMPWTGAKAVCFTESPWNGLIAHTERYSPYGIGFEKRSLFAKHGGPALYVRPDHFTMQEDEKNGFSEYLLPFVTPFSPSYRPKSMKSDIGNCDYSHEREWRVPHDFPFTLKEVKFVILGTYEDLAMFPRELKDAIGRDKFILMDNYRMIEKLWPVHII